ncbi:Rid family hydrolase [Microbacterium soli]|uniref:RidA family protein n=1 Tax=Microbacterium soli TaxID=446075 RepID=A0ABP7N652_9MICO
MTSRNSRRVIDAFGPADADLPWSEAILAGDWLFAGAQLASDGIHGLDPAARPDARSPWTQSPLGLESALVLERVLRILSAAGGDARQDLLRVWQWIRARYPDDDLYRGFDQGWPSLPDGSPYARNFARTIGDRLRASTGIGVRQLPVPDAMLSVDFLAVPGRGRTKEEIALPPEVPAPKAGYAPAVRYGDWVFLSGFGATDFVGDWMSDRHMGEPSMLAPEARVNPYIWLGSPIEAQTRYTLEKLALIAEAAGSSLDRCVKADVTLSHPADYPALDAVWREFFPQNPPARNVVTGTQLVIKGVRVEIALVLLADDSESTLECVQVEGPSAALGHASEAVRAGDLLFTSTLLPIDEHGVVPQDIRASRSAPYHRDTAAQQTDAIIGRLSALCDAAGTDLSQVCRVQTVLSDLTHLPAMSRSWRDAFPTEPPTLSAVGTGGPDPLLLPGAVVQWDAIAYAPQGAHR